MGLTLIVIGSIFLIGKMFFPELIPVVMICLGLLIVLLGRRSV